MIPRAIAQVIRVNAFQEMHVALQIDKLQTVRARARKMLPDDFVALTVVPPKGIRKTSDRFAGPIFDDCFGIQDFRPLSLGVQPGQVGMVQGMRAHRNSVALHLLHLTPVQHDPSIHGWERRVFGSGSVWSHRQKNRGGHVVLLKDRECLLVNALVPVIKGDGYGTFGKGDLVAETFCHLAQADCAESSFMQHLQAARKPFRWKGDDGRLAINCMKGE